MGSVVMGAAGALLVILAVLAGVGMARADQPCRAPVTSAPAAPHFPTPRFVPVPDGAVRLV